MSFLEPPPPASPTAEPAQPRPSATHLSGRLVIVNAAALTLVVVTTLALDDRTATRVAGSYTLGMLLLSAQAATMLLSALRYDRACSRAVDRRGELP
ncbi:hypothetical protein [Streptomyces sp. NPDC048002]|uniref:hypothetical protein n=1 Tax=Streptomyces sp. NPDC048002 TaxID=3154344 RepID=UPI0034050363